MSANKLKSFQEFSLVWSAVTVITFFIGLFLTVTTGFTNNPKLGKYFLASAIVSLLIYGIVAFFNAVRSKNFKLIESLIGGLILLAILMIVGGIVAMFMQDPNGATLLFSGLGILALYWVGILVKTILSKD